MNNLVLIDGHSLAYRMYFALERTQMSTREKFPTWGIYGFFKALFDLLRDYSPEGMAIAFDKSGDTFRNRMYTQYKAHRSAMPDAMTLQMAKVLEGVSLLGIPIFQIDDYEADDVIGTLARQAAAQGIHVTILTGDQDAFQVIDGDARISILVPSFQGGLVRYDRHKVFEKWGVYPEQVPDFKGLKGDASDNIPGVPGIGDKTASKLLAEYHTLEGVLENAEAVSAKKAREALIQYKEQAILSKDLATIRYDVPVDLVPEDCHLTIPDLSAFLTYLGELEFRSFITQSQSLLLPFLPKNSSVDLETSTEEALLIVDSGGADADSLRHSAAAAVDLLGNPEGMTLSGIAGGAILEVPHTIITTAEALTDFLSRISETNVLTIDIETSGLDVQNCTFAGISMSLTPALYAESRQTTNILNLSDYPTQQPVLRVNPDKAEVMETVYVALDHPDMQGQLSINEAMDLLKPVLADPAVIKIAHNAKFEINVFRRHGVAFAGLSVDTMILSWVLDGNRRHGLKSLAYEILALTMREITDLIGKGKKQIPFTEVPLAEGAAYSACDTYVAAHLAIRLLPCLTPSLETLFYELELPLVPVLAEMEYNGISLNTEYLSNLSQTLEQQIGLIETEIYDLAGEKFNLNSPKQVGEVFFDKLKLPAKGMTKSKSSYSTNAKIIEILAYDYPIARKLLDYRQLFKLKSTYVDALPALINSRDNRVHTSFNQTIASTGRLSSSDPNLQNIPIRSEIGREIRQAFVPAQRDNWEILSADYSQIELRLLAHFSEDPHLVEAFNANQDVHQATAALVFGMTLETVTKQQRYQAKAVNFGVIYGQSAFGLSNTLGIPPKEAGEFINRYFNTYGSVRTFIDITKAEARIKGHVTTLFGRVRDLSEGLNSPMKSIREFSERAAFNMPLQGTAADLMKAAMIRLQQALNREQLQSKLILQVHDEIVIEVYIPERERVKELVLWSMGLDQPLKVPLEVDISIGPTWMEVDEE